MNANTSFHPLQSFRHLCNRLDGNKVARDGVMSEIAEEQKRHEAKMYQLNAMLPDIIYRRKVLLEEGKELLPKLRGFGKCFDSLKAILGL